jgi:hypothetical protein
MTIPTPPRLTGNGPTDLASVIEWAWGLYRELALQNVDEKRLDRIAAVPPLPDTATTTDLIGAVNAVVVAAKKD